MVTRTTIPPNRVTSPPAAKTCRQVRSVLSMVFLVQVTPFPHSADGCSQSSPAPERLSMVIGCGEGRRRGKLVTFGLAGVSSEIAGSVLARPVDKIWSTGSSPGRGTACRNPRAQEFPDLASVDLRECPLNALLVPARNFIPPVTLGRSARNRR